MSRKEFYAYLLELLEGQRQMTLGSALFTKKGLSLDEVREHLGMLRIEGKVLDATFIGREAILVVMP